jgi:hypothetical protein
MREKLLQLLMDVAELNSEQAENASEKILSETNGEIGSDEWLQSLSMALSNILTSLHIDTPGLKIGEIIRKLQK